MPRPAHVAVAAILIVAALSGVYFYTVRPTKPPTETTEAKESSPQPDGAYHFDQARSKASFSLEEDLRGERITVVGVTSDVDGIIRADRTDLSSVHIMSVQVNARTFVTDNEQRNNAIRRLVLKTENDANEFIIFDALEIKGLPASAEIGQAIPVEISGNLTVSGSTKAVVFTGSFTFTSDNEITGSAETTVHYPDFGISVPNLPFLANVEQDAVLRIEFVATR